MKSRTVTNKTDSRLNHTVWPAQLLSRRIRLFGLGVLLVPFFSNAGCDDGGLILEKTVPAPIAEKFPYEIPAASRKAIWGGDNFEVKHEGVVHYLVLQGIDSPKPGQDYFDQSRNHLEDLIANRPLRVTVYGLDHEKREIARVSANDLDVSFEMIRAGLAWHDGNEFEDSESFKLAEKDARNKKIGLWKDPDPIHPSEFEARR